MAKKFVPKWFGEVDANAKLRLYDQEKFKQYIQKFKGNSIELQIKKKYKHRSLDANAYLWVIYTLIAEYTGYEPEDIHEIAKAKFLKKTKNIQGKIYEYVGSTSPMDTFDFSQYLEKVKLWAIEDFNLVIPDSEDYNK